ncbi:hypothetical protein AVEN_215461-1 [Araneus ventricosus]|uniref:Uncharacterized protein n=1 Tax=Araneus ventricosus TaxID=182803 RepID=A0A4Y2MLL3_ARAVE|nr:hypothetical protein AVEN_215461-1 [Araneus ventricosus]
MLFLTIASSFIEKGITRIQVRTISDISHTHLPIETLSLAACLASGIVMQDDDAITELLIACSPYTSTIGWRISCAETFLAHKKRIMLRTPTRD